MCALRGSARIGDGMVTKTERIREEAAALWIATFGEPPAPDLDSGRMIELVLNAKPPVSYSRLAASARARDLTWPKGPGAA